MSWRGQIEEYLGRHDYAKSGVSRLPLQLFLVHAFLLVDIYQRQVTYVNSIQCSEFSMLHEACE